MTHNHTEKPRTVAVAMSGGVDSSVAAALLVQQGYSVFGLTMQVWDFETVGGNVAHESACCSIESVTDARFVCHTLGIPHYSINLRDVFHERVIRNFIDEYLAGRTPNPCIICNHAIKWGALLEKAVQMGADVLATGHYARCLRDGAGGRMQLLRGRDREKDQAYALWGLTQSQLQRTLLPLGELTKSQVRDIAARLGLKTAQKAESQEICFIPDDDYERFLKDCVPGLADRVADGEIVNASGDVLGRHRGYPFYTIGQRKGLGVAAGERIYVNRIDPEANRVHVGPQRTLFKRGLLAGEANWVSEAMPEAPVAVTAKIRYNDPGFAATLVPISESRFRLEFREPQDAVTPGQSAVCYRGDHVVAGGIIQQALD